MLEYFWHWLGVTVAILWHPLRVTLARYANVRSVWCQKKANVTQSGCRMNTYCDAIWVLSNTRWNQFFWQGIEKLILTIVAVLRGQDIVYIKSFNYVTESL